MKIIREDQKRLVEFQTLQIGDVFIEDVDGSQFIQMKMTELGDPVEGANAVSLVTGEAYWIEPDCRVLLVKATLTIE